MDARQWLTVAVMVALMGVCHSEAPAKTAGNIARPDSIAIAYSQYLWPKVDGVATVYYVIDPASDPNATPNIIQAKNAFNADFPGVIQWMPWQSASADGPNYVDINLSASDLSGVCEANEGYEAKAAQPMTGSTACTVGTILHEMGHVIGLWHEFTRPDRNSYVTVSYANVIKAEWSNFLIATDDAQTIGAYDYASVMHYIPYAFSRNGLPVIESIPPGIPMAGAEGVPAQAGSSTVPSLPNFDYSAGDKETIERLYGAAPQMITVTSNPVGLSVIVDGSAVATPQTYSWPIYSSHTLDVADGVQMLSGYILNSENPPQPATFYYSYGRWNNTTSQSNTILVTPGNGSLPFPTTAPALSTYSANFVQLVPYTDTICPGTSPLCSIQQSGADPGSVAASPAPQTYSGLAGQFFVAREPVTLTATASTGWNFYEMNNGPYWLPGGLGANPKTFSVPDSGNPVDPTVTFSKSPIYTVNVQPQPSNSTLTATVDSIPVYVPHNYSKDYDSTWTPTSQHNVAVNATQEPNGFATSYNFASWSDGGAMSHSVTLPAIGKKYLATLTREYLPATNFDFPPCGGSVVPSPSVDGFYPYGQKFNLTATADTGWAFAGWTYDLTGTTTPTTLTANDETLVYANFNTVAKLLTLTKLTPSSKALNSAGFTLTLTGTGFDAATSNVLVNGQGRTPISVTPTVIKVAMTPADTATLGGIQVGVENFPLNWGGCAVFAEQTFLVIGKGAQAAAPTFSPPAGHYASAQMVSISDVLPGATIYYTTNGSTPTASSSVYQEPISVTASEKLKAYAAVTGYTRSAVATANYTIN